MNNKKNTYHQDVAWTKALNKQGFISCCQLLGSMANYIQNKNNEISEEEERWFTKFSWTFLRALQNTPRDDSAKVVFCEQCLNFYNRLKKSVE